MAGKRVATSRISKDDPEGTQATSEGEDGHEHEGNLVQVMPTERKISRPAKRHVPSISGVPSNPFAKGGRSNPFSLLREEGEEDKERKTISNTSSNDNERSLQILGLNHSFSQALRQKLEREPAADLTPIFRQYENHWKTIAAQYLQGTKKGPITVAVTTQDKPAASPSGPPRTDISSEGTAKAGFFPTFGTEAGKSSAPASTGPETDRPAQSTAAFGAGANKLAESLASGAETAKFTAPSAPATESLKKVPASLPNEGPKTAADKPAPFTFGVGPSSDKPAPFTFGGSIASSADKPSAPFTFGSLPGKSAFSFGQPPAAESSGGSAAAVSTNPPPFSFSAFNSGTSTDSATTAVPPKPTSASPATAPPSFSFGGLTSSSSAPAAAPFSFSFSTPLPSFSTQASTAASASASASANDGEEEGIPEGEEASFSGERTNTELIKRGAGEEDEETLKEERIKLFSLEKEGGDGWKDLGVALAKINRLRGTEKRRLLARSEGTGKVLLNTWIGSAAIKVDYIEGKKDFTLICMGAEGKPVQYLIRCKEPAQAAAFSAAMGQQ